MVRINGSVQYSWAILALAAVLFSQNGWGAARSVKVVIKNDTSHAMIFVSGSAQHGIVTQRPPSRIPPSGVGELFAESNGFATGTEGRVTYRLEGVNGNAVFHWDNPFAGSNSANGSAPAGFKVEQIGDAGNRTLVFFSLHDANQPAARCNPDWIIAHLGKHSEDRLDGFDRDIGFLTTPFKRLGVGGWVDTGCDATAEGWPVRDAQHSTDGFWTIDVKLQKFSIMGRSMPAGPQLFVRIEVEPGTAAHAKAGARTNQFIRFHGHVLIDTHHGDELVEVHPADPITLAPEPQPFGKDTCKQGFVWREAVPNDHVCVTGQRRDQTRTDNSKATERRANGSPSAPDTCKQGFVWRETIPADHVCVTPQTRADAKDDNRHAAERRVR
ncbi:MAG TPA: hypothetical protein VNW97_18525 [Candidatus Saccharimonadales bacterium]|nr:hypothetical protein [Candidatus Saccharimonadales bacterium]